MRYVFLPNPAGEDTCRRVSALNPQRQRHLRQTSGILTFVPFAVLRSPTSTATTTTLAVLPGTSVTAAFQGQISLVCAGGPPDRELFDCPDDGGSAGG